MSAKDLFHDHVRAALEAEGWTITHDPYRLKIGNRKAFIDLAAEGPIAAEKEGRRIAVEIKSFLGRSPLDDLENALGQFGVYRAILEVRDPRRVLYLAVPDTARDVFLGEKDFRLILSSFQARLIVFSPDKQEVLEWIESTNLEQL